MKKAFLGYLLVFATVSAGAGEKTPVFKVGFKNGAVVSWTDAAGRVLANTTETSTAAIVHMLDKDCPVTGETPAVTVGMDSSAQESALVTEGDAKIAQTYVYDPDAKELIVTQAASSPRGGMWGVEWSISGIPLEMNILVPGYSGLRLTRATPGSEMSFDYPMSWEAGLVIVEGQGYGFYVWAEDAKPGYKRLVVKRQQDGWSLSFITIANAPFEEKREVPSLRWRLGTYDGGWQVPAKRYRDWMQRAFGPIRVQDQQPAWVKEIRACVIMGLDIKVLEALPLQLDPKQTLIYQYDWRTEGYDRDYPDYDEIKEGVDAFIQRAHELGFRVMLHVNYFGCDPLNALYEQFKPYQVRSPWGGHEPEWWNWTDADPPIKFAYINPAYKPWRDLLAERLSRLCRDHAVDALHLDQTLCMNNDYNGLVDGMTMIEGNVALHRDLREAMPDVALSGEGLDEVTCRMEAFAQRHVFGMDHTRGTFSVEKLRMTHPISSYLLVPYTVIYGYLGCAAPGEGQLYAGWQEAYRNYGVIPTLKPVLGELEKPTGFSAQFFDEVKFWQKERVMPDPDGPWTKNTAFPLRTAAGKSVAYTTDRRLVFEESEIIRTVYGECTVEGPGSIEGWNAYDDTRLLNLDPGKWYPYRESVPREKNAFHVASAFPQGFTLDTTAVRDGMAFVRSRTSGDAEIRLGDFMLDAVCGSKPFNGPAIEVRGELHGKDGSKFEGWGDHLSAHPPYLVNGTGIAFARMTVPLPEDAEWFLSGVGLSTGAEGEGRSDGVTFSVKISADGQKASAELNNATCTPQPLRLDVRQFAGKQAVVELSIDPGPNKNPSYDWAEWFNPRILRRAETEGEVTIATDPGRWTLALSAMGERAVDPCADRITLPAHFPGAVYLLKERPGPTVFPVDLSAVSREVFCVGDTGIVAAPAGFVGVTPGEFSVGGMKRAGLFAHPPNQGRTQIDIPITFAQEKSELRFHAWVGLRDGSEKSRGVIFRVEMNGVTLASEKITAGAWKEISAGLDSKAGKTGVLSMITDADGDYVCDWACWGGPRIERVSE